MCNSWVSSEEPIKSHFVQPSGKRWMKIKNEQKHNLPAHLMAQWHWCFLAHTSPQVELYVISFPSSTRESLWGILWLFKSLALCQVALGAMQLRAFLPVGLNSNWHSCIQLGKWSVRDYHNQITWSCVLPVLCCSISFTSAGVEPLGLALPCSHCCDADRGGLDCILGKISSVKEQSNIETGWHFTWWNHHPWKCWNNVWMWCLGTWLSCGIAGLMAGLNDLRGLFQPSWYYEKNN